MGSGGLQDYPALSQRRVVRAYLTAEASRDFCPIEFCEGYRKRSKADKIYSYDRAQHSLEEARYQLILAHDLEYADTKDICALLDEVARMLDAYIRAIKDD